MCWSEGYSNQKVDIQSRRKAWFIRVQNTGWWLDDYSKIYGLDYCGTYSLVLWCTIIRSQLATSNHFVLELHRMEVVTTFPDGELADDVYMEVQDGMKAISWSSQFVIKWGQWMVKSNAKKWNTKISLFSESLSLISSSGSLCFYVKWKDYGDFMIIALYVNNLLCWKNHRCH